MIGPRFELEEAPAARLEFADETVRVARFGVGSGVLLLSGLCVLLLGFASLSAGNFIAAQFQRAAALGWGTLAVALLGFGLLGAAFWREAAGLAALDTVDATRRALAHPDRQRAAALAWAARTPEGRAVLPALREANDPDAILALLRAGPGAALQRDARALGRSAAIQAATATAAVPSAALESLLLAWRGVRLVREIAALHGMRPGLLGTLALLRRVALSAGFVLAAEAGTEALIRTVGGLPLIALAAEHAVGATVAARRMMVLARVTEAACSPLPPS